MRLTHAEAQALVSARLDGPLDPVAERELNAHLATCDSCRAFSLAASSLARDLQNLPYLPPSPAVTRAVLEHISTPRTPLAWLVGSWSSRTLAGAGAVALALVILVATAFGALRVFDDLRDDRAQIPAATSDPADLLALVPGDDPTAEGGPATGEPETSRESASLMPDEGGEGAAATGEPDAGPESATGRMPSEGDEEPVESGQADEPTVEPGDDEDDGLDTIGPPGAAAPPESSTTGPVDTTGNEANETGEPVVDATESPSDTLALIGIAQEPETGTPGDPTATAEPSVEPTREPTAEPTASPEPTAVPTDAPTPTPEPTASPTAEPTEAPTPTPVPTEKPTEAPTPTPEPTEEPTETPTATPTAEPTAEPTATPSPEPTATPVPTAEPTEEPTATPVPTEEPTEEPTPTPEPTEEPTATPTPEPTAEPTAEPTEEPTVEPTQEPTAEQTPTPVPTQEPTATPVPTEEPTATPVPTEEPTATPTVEPTEAPTPTEEPTATPEPTEAPDPTSPPIEPAAGSTVVGATSVPEPTEPDPTLVPTDVPDDDTGEQVIEPVGGMGGGDDPTVEPTTEPVDDAVMADTAPETGDAEPDQVIEPGESSETAGIGSGPDETAQTEQRAPGGQFDGTSGGVTLGAGEPYAGLDRVPGEGARLAPDGTGGLVRTDDPGLASTRANGLTAQGTGQVVEVCGDGGCVAASAGSATAASVDRPLGWLDGELVYQRVGGETHAVEFRALRVDPGSLAVLDDRLIGGGGAEQELVYGPLAVTGRLLGLAPGGWLAITADQAAVIDGNPYGRDLRLIRLHPQLGWISYVVGGELIVAGLDAPGQAIAAVPFGGQDYDLAPSGERIAVIDESGITILDLAGQEVATYLNAEGIAVGGILWPSEGVLYVDYSNGVIRRIQP